MCRRASAWRSARQRTPRGPPTDPAPQALAAELAEATVRGISAGLHVTAELPGTDDEQAVRREAERRGIWLSSMSDYSPGPHDFPPTLILGYSQLSESQIRSGVRELAEAVRAARANL